MQDRKVLTKTEKRMMWMAIATVIACSIIAHFAGWYALGWAIVGFGLATLGFAYLFASVPRLEDTEE